MLETILAKLGLPFLVSAVARALGAIDNPVAQGAAKSLGDVQDAFTRGSITPEQQLEANRHIETMTQIEQGVEAQKIAEINASLRVEVASQDAYVRRMRPTFGYLMAFTWAAQMFALAYVIIFETSQASLVITAMEKLGTIWAVGLSVLGIYVYKRSDEKKSLRI